MIWHRVGELFRREDVSGISGTGIVAQVTEFSSGKCAVAWLGEDKTVTVFDSIAAVMRVHGHQGKTVIYWADGSVQYGPDDVSEPAVAPAACMSGP